MKNIIKTYLKLPYKSIDLDVINYVIEDILNNDVNDYSDQDIINIIKAFCYKCISNMYTDFDIEVVDQKVIDSKSKLCNVDGLLIGKKIYLEKETILDLKNKNVEILRVVMHEVQHVKQRHLIEFKEINYRAYLIIIEKILIFEMQDEYYRANYKYFFEEIDARLEAEFKLYDYLAVHSPDVLACELSDICENVDECEKDAENLIRIVNDKKYEREELFDRIIRKKPEYMELYPILNFYYNPDGSKINIGNIIARSQCETNNVQDKKIIDKVKKLDMFIIKNRRGSRYNLNKDIKSLLMYQLANLISKEELESLIKYLSNCYDENNSNYIYDIYDSLIYKLDYFKNVVTDTIDATNKATTKIYLKMQNINK